MPIILGLKDIKWSESENAVQICVPLKGVNKKGISILSSSRYLKISFPPYFWEAFLKDSIDPNLSEARVGNDVVSFVLAKKNDGLWNELLNPSLGDKLICQQLRSEAMKEVEKTLKEDDTNRKTDKGNKKRFTVKMQMKLDEIQRKRIESLKEAERQNVTDEIEKWKSKKMCNAVSDEKNRNEVPEMPDAEKQLLSNNENYNDNNLNKIFTSKELASFAGEKASKKKNLKLRQPLSSVNNKSSKFMFNFLPEPRTTGHISVNFTPRVFPTASRESQHADEEKWLQHQAEARQSMAVDCADLKPEERNPQWLKDKGDQFYAKGDYLAAVNAYNLAIRMCPKMYSLYSNRSACHLQLHNLHKCIEDASKALELLQPQVEDNCAARLKCHVRRGTAFCQMKLYIEGLQDYEAAIRLSPNDSQLQCDIKRIRSLVQQSAS